MAMQIFIVDRVDIVDAVQSRSRFLGLAQLLLERRPAF